MMRIRLAKVFQDIWGYRVRSVLIILSIAVGLVALGTISGTRSILSTEMGRSYAAIQPSSGVVRTLQPFDQDFLESVRRMDGVAEADARRVINAQIILSSGKTLNLMIFAISDYDAIRINKISAQEGAWPPPPRQLLIERAAAPLLETAIGKHLTIKTSDGKVRQMPIAGIVHDPAQLPANIDGTPYVYISFDTLEWFNEPYGFNELYILTRNPADPEYSQRVVSRVKAKAEDSGYIIPISLTAEPGQLPLDDLLQSVLVLMGLMGVLALFLSCFLIINTVTAQLAQQRRQIGVMKGLGASSSQVMWLYLLAVILYGAAALTVAAPVSYRAAQELSQFLATLFNFDLAALEPPASAFWLQAGVALVTPVMASLWPLLSSVRISAAEAMSAYSDGKKQTGRGWMTRLISGKNLWFARNAPVRSLLLSLRNTFRSRGRLVLTLVTLTLASAIFVSVFGLQASLSATLDDIMNWMKFDYMVSFDQPYRIEKMRQVAMQIPEVIAVDGQILLPVRLMRADGSEGKTFFLYSIPYHSKLANTPKIVAGRWLHPNDANAVVVSTVALKDEPGLQLGGMITLKINGKEQTFKIVGIAQGIPFLGNLFTNYSYIASRVSRAGQADSAMIRVAQVDDHDLQRLQAELETSFEQVGMEVVNIQTLKEERSDASAFFAIIVSLLMVMAALMALVGGLGLMGTMSINVLERTREIGVLRAIGASNLSVAQVFVLEGLAIGWMSWLLGSLLAYPLTQALSQVVGATMLGVPLTFAYSTTGVWVWLVIVTVLSALASLIPARNASHLTVREVLAYE